jgi:hypothetical protein
MLCSRSVNPGEISGTDVCSGGAPDGLGGSSATLNTLKPKMKSLYHETGLTEYENRISPLFLLGYLPIEFNLEGVRLSRISNPSKPGFYP